MKNKYHIVPSTGEVKPCQAQNKCKYENSIHGDSKETRNLYEKSMSVNTIIEKFIFKKNTAKKVKSSEDSIDGTGK